MDAALQLYPLPDLIVTADKFNSFSTSHMECKVMNPVSISKTKSVRHYLSCKIYQVIIYQQILQGSFPRSEFSFKVYVPATKTVEDSQIPDET